MTKVQKVEKLFKKMFDLDIASNGDSICGRFFLSEKHKNKLYHCTYEVNHHNGNIEDYEEYPVTEDMISDNFIAELENEIYEYFDNIKKQKQKKAAVRKFIDKNVYN